MLFMLDLMQLACERVGVAGSLKWKCRRRSPKCRRRSPPSPLPPGLAVRSVAGKRTAGLGPAGKAEAERMASREENVGVGGVARSGSAVGDDTDGVDGNVVISWPGCTEERVEDVLSVRRTVSAEKARAKPGPGSGDRSPPTGAARDLDRKAKGRRGSEHAEASVIVGEGVRPIDAGVKGLLAGIH